MLQGRLRKSHELTCFANCNSVLQFAIQCCNLQFIAAITKLCCSLQFRGAIDNSELQFTIQRTKNLVYFVGYLRAFVKERLDHTDSSLA